MGALRARLGQSLTPALVLVIMTNRAEVTMTKRVSVAEAKSKLSELLGRVAYGGERFIIEKRGRPMAALGPVPEAPAEEAPAEEADDWVYHVAGLFADCPDVLDAIDEAVARRCEDMPRPVHLAWDEPE